MHQTRKLLEDFSLLAFVITCQQISLAMANEIFSLVWSMKYCLLARRTYRIIEIIMK